MCINPIKIKTVDKNNDVVIKEVPCGHCLECMQQKSTDIVIRGIIEYKKYNKKYTGSFITLTYNDKFLPENRSLKKQDYIVFLRELRRYIAKTEGRTGIRILGCGEYGTKKGRPHYHLVIFNWIPDDLKVDHSANVKNNNILYKSKTLSKIWGKGRVVVGTASEQTIGYIAGYTSKKGFKNTKKYIKNQYENRISKQKNIYYDFNDETKLIKWTSKNGQTYIKRVKVRNKREYIREFEFIATPRGKLGGLGSLPEQDIIDLVNAETISLNCGKEVKTFSIPYYYKKKLKEIYDYREYCNNHIYTADITDIINLDKILKFHDYNYQQLIKIEYTLENDALRIQEIKKENRKIAEKHGMNIKEWKNYKSNIKKNKIKNRLRNLKRDFDENDESQVNRPWFLENEIGKEFLRESTLCFV